MNKHGEPDINTIIGIIIYFLITIFLSGYIFNAGHPIWAGFIIILSIYLLFIKFSKSRT